MSDDRLIAFRFPVALVLSIVCLATLAWADYEAGWDAYNRGDYGTAFREWRPLVEQGDANAQVLLGMLYDKGQRGPQDSVQARLWFEKAAAKGNAMPRFGSVRCTRLGKACRRTLSRPISGTISQVLVATK